MITFVVPGPAIGKQRPRVVRRGSAVIAYTPKKTMDYERRVRAAAADVCRRPLDGPIRVIISVSIQPPKSWSKAKAESEIVNSAWAMRKPDLDNVAKAILDAMAGTCFRDDQQVVSLEISRRWGREDAVRVWVRTVD